MKLVCRPTCTVRYYDRDIDKNGGDTPTVNWQIYCGFSAT